MASQGPSVEASLQSDKSSRAPSRNEHALGRFKAHSRPHLWTALVQPCALCGDFAARWRCAPCQESYCATCYSRLHSQGTRLAHACTRLGYYTADMHSHDEQTFRENVRQLKEKSRHESACAAEPQLRAHAVLRIQRSYRAAIGRYLGQTRLRTLRKGARCAWPQRRTSAPVWNGLESNLAVSREDGRLHQVMKRIAFWKQESVSVLPPLGLNDHFSLIVGERVHVTSSHRMFLIRVGAWAALQMQRSILDTTWTLGLLPNFIFRPKQAESDYQAMHFRLLVRKRFASRMIYEIFCGQMIGFELGGASAASIVALMR